MTTEINQHRLDELIVAAINQYDYGDFRWGELKSGITEEELVELSKHFDFRVREAVMWNHNAPIEILAKGAQDEHADVRRAVMGNRITPVEILKVGAQDTNHEVREMVMGNANTPVDVLDKGANDPDEYVREEVMGNPNATVEILLKGLKDKYESVRSRALDTVIERDKWELKLVKPSPDEKERLWEPII
jgi:hypothetical protein